MAITVVFDGTRLSGAESETDGGTWDQWDSGKSPTQETDFVYQRGASNAAISTKVGTSPAGVEFEATTAVNYSSTTRCMLFKVIATNPAALNTRGANGMILYVGSGTTTDRRHYYVHGSDTYPIAGGWVFIPVDPGAFTTTDAQDGARNLSAVNYYAISCDFTATSKAENVAMDAVDYFTVGTGLTLTGNTPDGVFQDFIDEDEGTEANRWAVVRTVEDIIYCLGTLTIGSSGAATSFTDQNRVLVFPDAPYLSAGFGGIKANVENASSDITLVDIAFIGRGQDNRKFYFDSELNIDDPAADEITVDHFGTGDEVWIAHEALNHNLEGGSAITGLVAGALHSATDEGSESSAIYDSRANSWTATSPVSPVPHSANTGESHSLRRTPDRRPDFTVVGTSGTVDMTGCTFDRFRQIVLTSAATATSCKFVNCSTLTQSTGTLDSCTITAPLLGKGEAFIVTPDLGNVSDCQFATDSSTGRTGHMLEITASGVYSFVGNTFANDWSHSGDAGKGAEFDTTTGVNDVSDIITTNAAHGFTSGDAVYYNNAGGSATPGPTNGNRYYVDVLSSTTLTLYVTWHQATIAQTNPVSLTSAGGENHALYSEVATILNSSGGNVQIDIVNGDGLTVRNATNSDTATVNVSVPIEINGLTEGSFGAMFGSAAPELGNELLSGYADSTGKITGSFSGTTPQAVSVRARNAGIVSAVIQDDGGAFTDFTLAARNRTSPGGGAANDVDLLPATVTAGDALYIAGLAEFGEVELDVSTAGDTYVLTWEYWNGAWVALTVVDGTNSFQTAGWNKITFTKPGDWATTSINSQGPFFYIRARVTTGGGTQPKGETFTLANTIKYRSFNGSGTIATTTGLTTTPVWEEDLNNP